jgi:hypothetical protein
MAYIYRHIRLDKNEPFYVGIGSDDNFKYKRACEKENRNKHWYNIVKKTQYEVEIILDNLTWDEACEKEVEFIKLYGREDLNEGILCNMTNGGEGVLGMKHSDKTKKILSDDNKRPEKMAVCMKNYKKMLTPEAREKARNNRDYKEISRKRMLNTDREALLKKIIERCAKPVLQYSLDGEFIREWVMGADAVRSIDKLKSSNLTKCLQGKRKSAGGYIWKYKNNI